MITLRPATMADAELLYEWATDAETRRQSFHPETFDFEHHCRWLERKLESPSSLCLIGMDGQRPVGTIRFEIDRQTALVSFTVAPVERGKGYGTALLQAGTAYLFESGMGDKVQGRVKSSNAASLQCFQKAGFTGGGDAQVDGVGCTVFERTG